MNKNNRGQVGLILNSAAILFTGSWLVFNATHGDWFWIILEAVLFVGNVICAAYNISLIQESKDDGPVQK